MAMRAVRFVGIICRLRAYSRLHCTSLRDASHILVASFMPTCLDTLLTM
jgi:hypothetical protein